MKADLIFVTGKVRVVSNGKHTFSECALLQDGFPVADRFDTYGRIDLPPGKYSVPYEHIVRNGRPEVQYDFGKAEALKGA